MLFPCTVNVHHGWLFLSLRISPSAIPTNIFSSHWQLYHTSKHALDLYGVNLTSYFPQLGHIISTKLKPGLCILPKWLQCCMYSAAIFEAFICISASNLQPATLTWYVTGKYLPFKEKYLFSRLYRDAPPGKRLSYWCQNDKGSSLFESWIATRSKTLMWP